MSKGQHGSGFIHKVATFIVDKRNLFFLLYIIAIVFSLISMGWTDVENDIIKYLPEDTETRQGIDAMNSNFTTPGSARIMVKNVTYATGEALCSALSEVDGVLMVSYDQSHYKDANALFDVTFAGSASDAVSVEAIGQIRELLAGYDVSIDSLVGTSDIEMLESEMTTILIVAVIIVLIVLTLTSRAYAEVPVLILTFGIAALLNMGTNYLCGTISFISDSVAVVLQLALAVDYAIILCHRFSDEHETKSARDACIAALAKSIPEVSASSLTTICGLIALGFMEFGIGLDMSIVLIKSIICSLLSVFTLMPGLLMLFSPLIDKTKHKKLLPSISFLGKFAVKARRIVPPVFLICLVAAFFLSSNCPYAFSFSDIRTSKMTEQQTAYFDIRDTFGNSNMVAVLVPRGDYDAEAAVLDELSRYPEVESTMGLAGIALTDDYMITDSLTPRQFSELIGLDFEVAQALYSAYALDSIQYGEIIDGLETYSVPLFDMFMFLKDTLDNYNISLDTGDGGTLDKMFRLLDSAESQMQSEAYSRMVVYLNLLEEGEETFAFLDEMRSVIGRHYEDDYYIVGNSTNARDLSKSFETDNTIISVLSILFVIIVLLFTFQSVGMPILLIIVIQGSIWINFSIPALIHQPLYFLGYLIVSAIQMGANIDYAIVLSSHYREAKEHLPPKDAIIQAVNSAFPTVFTSGIMMSSAGLLIGNLSAQPVVAIMGTCLGRGTIISMVLVLGILPSILVLGDSIVARTSFKIKIMEPRARVSNGTIHLQGHLRGHISGYVDADFSGVLHGQLDASVTTSNARKKNTPPDPGQAEEEGGKNA